MTCTMTRETMTRETMTRKTTTGETTLQGIGKVFDKVNSNLPPPMGVAAAITVTRASSGPNNPNNNTIPSDRNNPISSDRNNSIAAPHKTLNFLSSEMSQGQGTATNNQNFGPLNSNTSQHGANFFTPTPSGGVVPVPVAGKTTLDAEELLFQELKSQ